MDNTDLLQAVTVDLLWAAGFVAVEYLCVLLAVLADLWSGWRKAGRRKERRTSRGLRNTVDKVARYFNALIALTVIDIMIIAGAAYLRSTQGWNIPIFPVCTLVGAVALALIEVKSIYENASEKGDMQEAAALLKKVLSSVSAAEILAWIDRNRDS
ncbi:MAG: phage holin family protein [Muribaculaceae bacterium]|nr:phage holin family protein [Muribaculaceae bacterium]